MEVATPWQRPMTQAAVAALKAEAQALDRLGLQIITVIPEPLPADRWPQKDRKGEVVPDKDGNPRPAFVGKNPSHWVGRDLPRLLSHARPEPLAAVLAKIDTAAKHGHPIGLGVIPSDRLVIVDLDAKDYEGGAIELEADYRRLVAAHPELARTRTERTPSGGIHIYTEVADGMASWSRSSGGRRCRFTTITGGPHRGEMLSGTRISVTAPTAGSLGAYRLLEGTEDYAHTLVKVPSLGAIGITPHDSSATSQQPFEWPVERPVESHAGEQQPPHLRDLLRSHAAGVLNGGRPYGEDRSGNMTGFLKELYGLRNWLDAEGLPYAGSVDELILEAAQALDIEDKLNRVIDTIDANACTWGSDPKASRGRYDKVMRGGWPADGDASGFPSHPDGYDQGRDGRQRQGQQQGQPQGRDDQQQRPGPYQVLGWCKDREKVWYRHRQTAQIASVKPSGQAELLKLADLSYWGDRYPRQDKDGNKIMGINWARAAADLIKAANNAGVFQLEKMRGRGVWLDGGQVVWHLGHALEVDGKPVSLTDYRSAHQYALMQSLPIKTQVEPLDDAHGQKILKVLRDCAWIGASDHLHLAGFCVLSSVCGALDKRPGLQITSPFSSGKTDTIDNVIMPLQGGIGLLSSGSTEAGVRQLLGSDALPATIDESEAEEGRRREAQLRLVRFSYDGKPQFKGTPGQGALTYCLRSSLALAGINSPIDNPADGSRIAIISRRMLPADQWAVVTRRRSAVITQEIGQRLIRRTVSTLPALQANVATFKEVITAMVTTGEAGRTGDTWGALLAGAHHLVSTQAISKAEAAAWLDSVGWHLSHTDADEQDRRAGAEGRQCLDHLLSHETRWIHPGDRDDERPSTGSVALRELTALVRRSFKFIDKDEAEKELGRKGIRVMLEGLAVANHAPGTAVIFSKTKWANGAHKARLLELDGATRSSGPIHFACSGSRRAVLVPWAAVGDLGDEEAAQAA